MQAVATRLAALSERTLDLMDALEQVSALAVTLLPSCVGVSITVMVDGDAFTVTATAPAIATLDATQYVDAGPCVDAATGSGVVSVDDVLDEDRWRLYALAAAASGVRSSVSLPLRDASGAAAGALNLYASEPAAFDDVRAQLAELFGAHVDELVRNADLAFVTRDHARRLPHLLEEREHVDTAVRALVHLHGWTPAEARERLEVAAAHAGTSRAAVARVVMVLDT